MAAKLVQILKLADDFIIDSLLQPGINLAAWYFGVSPYLAAKISLGAGAVIGLIWIHKFSWFPDTDFYLNLFNVGILVLAVYAVIRRHEANEPKRQALMPQARATGFILRSIWLVLLSTYVFEIPVESHQELAMDFVWTVFVVLPNWIICCRRPPPLERRSPVKLATIPIN